MNRVATPAREKVIRESISEIREAIIKTQFEVEYIEECLNRAEEARKEISQKASELGGLNQEINENTDPNVKGLLTAYTEVSNAIDSMIKALNDQKALEHSLILKLDFFKLKRTEFEKKKEIKKKKRTEKFIEESKELMKNAPEKICVDTSKIEYSNQKK